MYTHLLIAIDGSEPAYTALEHGVALARKLAAKVTIVTVTEPWHATVAGDAAIGFPVDDYDASNAKWAAGVLSRAETVATKAGVKPDTVHVPSSYPAEGIIEAAKDHGCDLIIMGSHERGLSHTV